jgi:hypothetical protein
MTYGELAEYLGTLITEFNEHGFLSDFENCDQAEANRRLYLINTLTDRLTERYVAEVYCGMPS